MDYCTVIMEQITPSQRLDWSFAEVCALLERSDPKLRGLFLEIGPREFFLQPDPFVSLVHAIIGQQISTRAAQTIFGRVTEMLGNSIAPETLLAVSAEDLRSCGVSARKIDYLRDLATHFGRIGEKSAPFHELSDDEVEKVLVQIKGIGLWTARMCMIFSLGRMDVFASDDLGLVQASQQLYALKTRPERQWLEKQAAKWSPYRSIASRYLWLSLNNSGGTATPEG